MLRVTVLAAAVVMSGCAGKVDYIKPTALVDVSKNSKVLNRSKEEVWNSAVPELGKKFFVINNLDKSSGLINISYSGDPERYVDCGRVTSMVKNARGERFYDFAGAKAQQRYEIMDDMRFFEIARQMDLDGRMNLVFEETEAGKTRVTANTRYVVQRKLTIVPLGGNFPQSFTDSVSFNAGSRGVFPASKSGQGTECVATGELENEVLSLIK